MATSTATISRIAPMCDVYEVDSDRCGIFYFRDVYNAYLNCRRRKRNTRNAGTIADTKRVDVSEYPMDVVREAITNAVAHRDYSIAGSRIRVFILDDRLEIISPGRLPNTINLENIAYRQYSRNRLIMEYLLKMGYVERLGTGIRLMLSRMRELFGREP